MKKTIAFIFLYFIISLSAWTQQVFDVGGNIDKFSIGDKEVRYKRKIPSGISIIEQGTLFPDNGIILRDTVLEKKSVFPYYKSVSADTLPTMTIEDWERLMKNKTLIIYRDSSKVSMLNMHQGSLMFYAEYEYHNPGAEIKAKLPDGFEYTYAYFIPGAYSYLKLSENKYIILLSRHQLYDSSFDGYIIPFKDRLELQIRHINRDVDYNVPSCPLYDKDSLYYRDLYARAFYTVTLTNAGRQQLCDFFGFAYPLIADSIQWAGDYIIANDLKKQQCIVYDKLLNKQPLKNIRCVTSNLQMLQGKKVKWFENGKLLDNPTKHWSSWPDSPSRYYYKIEKRGDGFLFYRAGRTQYGEERKKQEFTLTNPETADSIFFENRQTTLNTFHYPGEGTGRDIDILYIKTKEGKYNICTYTTDIDANTFTVIPMLTTNVDWVEMKHPRYFYDQGKVGYYPEMRTADYKEINELNGKFLRVKTLQGKRAWYNMENKRLYYD